MPEEPSYTEQVKRARIERLGRIREMDDKIEEQRKTMIADLLEEKREIESFLASLLYRAEPEKEQGAA